MKMNERKNKLNRKSVEKKMEGPREGKIKGIDGGRKKENE